MEAVGGRQGARPPVLVTHPPVLLMDGISTGLDSAAAFEVCAALRSLARCQKKTVVATACETSSPCFHALLVWYLHKGASLPGLQVTPQGGNFQLHKRPRTAGTMWLVRFILKSRRPQPCAEMPVCSLYNFPCTELRNLHRFLSLAEKRGEWLGEQFWEGSSFWDSTSFHEAVGVFCAITYTAR